MPDPVSKTFKLPFLPADVKPFLIKGLLLFVGWKLLYLLVLQPANIPDEWLTTLTRNCVKWILSFFYSEVSSTGHTIFVNNTETITIANQCNGLELFVLYIGFLLCVPTSFTRLISFSIIGVFTIFALNVLRNELLAMMYYHGSYFVDFAHHYAFKLIIYGVVFLGWVLYAKKAKTA